MNKLRSIGMLLIACSLVCFLVAYDKYVSAVATNKAVAEQISASIPEFQYESSRIPQPTILCGAVGVALLVAGITCLLDYAKNSRSASGSDAELLG